MIGLSEFETESEPRAHNTSIAEFLDGFPSFNENSFSRFNSRHCQSKYMPPYIATNDQPSDQIIVNDNSHMLLKNLHEQWDKKHGCRKRLLEASEESGSTSRKRPRVDQDNIIL